MKFEINALGKVRIKQQSNEVMKFKWSAIPLMSLFYLGIKYGMGNEPFMYAVGSWIFLIYLIIPIILSRKIKKVIFSIEFLEECIKIETKKGFIDLNQFKIREANGEFSGFGKSHTSGYLIRNLEDDKEYWLIDTFYNDMEDIEKELIQLTNQARIAKEHDRY